MRQALFSHLKSEGLDHLLDIEYRQLKFGIL